MIEFSNDRVSHVTQIYLLSRDISPKWMRQVENRMEQLVGWLGDDPPFGALDCMTANRWLAELQRTSGLSSHTIHGYRTALHAVWRFAYEESFTDIPPMRLRKIKREPILVQAYTHEHLRRLRLTAKELPRNIEGTNIPRCLWWSAYIPTAYSTALRKGCLLALEKKTIQADGTIVVIAKKTGKLTARRIDSTALAAINALAEFTQNTSLVFPYAKAEHVFFDDFRQLVVRAGLPEGSTSKWVRRSGISYGEAEEPGRGQLLGGHSDDRVTNRSYRDMKIAPPPIVEPPAMEW